MTSEQTPARRWRWSTLLELAALGLGCLVLGYFTCRDAPEVSAEQRGSRIFSAPRAEGGQVSDAEGGRREIERVLGSVLTGIATGEVREEQRGELQKQLLGLLEQRGSGRPETRANASGMIVQQLFDRAKLASVSPELTRRQREAIASLARELTRQLLLLAVGASPGADALPVSLPEGFTKLDWKRLGGFRYVEGGSLPAEIQAQDGQRAGLPGFILSLGDTQGMREFVLLESLWGCCFGSVPELNQTIVVRLAADRAIDYTGEPVLVTGTLQVGEEREGGFVTSLYRIVDATAQPLAPPRAD